MSFNFAAILIAAMFFVAIHYEFSIHKLSCGLQDIHKFVCGSCFVFQYPQSRLSYFSCFKNIPSVSSVRAVIKRGYAL